MTMKTFAATLALVLLCAWCHAGGLPTSDNFDDNIKDTSRWGLDGTTGHGALVETNQHLEFHLTGAPTDFDQTVRPWKPSFGSFTADWELRVDTQNSAVPGGTNKQTAAGISINAGFFLGNNIIIVQVTGTLSDGSPYAGFLARLGTPDTNGVYVQVLNLTNTTGAVRLAFNSTNKVCTVYYDTDPTDGYQWTQLAAFGVAGSGGADGNLDWQLTNGDQFQIALYGYSNLAEFPDNAVALDNYVSTGLVAPLAPHDLTITKLKVSKTISLSEKKPQLTKKAIVTIQNLGPNGETITAATLTNLVDFHLKSLAPATCATPPVPVLIPPKTLPAFLPPKKSLNLSYNITFSTDCVNNPAKGAPDFSYEATIHREAIDGAPDTTSINDDCPRLPSSGDKGCGAKTPSGTLGGDVLTDVIVK